MSKTKIVSRQREWQIKQISLGRCMICGKAALHGHQVCGQHYAYRIKYYQNIIKKCLVTNRKNRLLKQSTRRHDENY